MFDGMNRRNFLGLGTAASVAAMAPRWMAAQSTPAAKQDAKPRDEQASKPIEVSKLYDNLFLLQGTGGNMALQTGPDGNLLIDSSYTRDLPRIREAIAALAPGSVSMPGILVNTHLHSDHIGGNEGLHAAGFTIFSHSQTRARLSAPQNTAVGALPAVTFSNPLQVWRNGEQIDMACFEPAHTDSDVYINFRKADVLHVGDTWFNGLYPYIDGEAGGSIGGMIRACEKTLAVAGSSTKIIPGHGPVGTKARLQVYRDMLSAVRDKVAALKTGGASEAEAIAKKPTAEFDAAWASSFLNGDAFTRLVYRTL